MRQNIPITDSSYFSPPHAKCLSQLFRLQITPMLPKDSQVSKHWGCCLGGNWLILFSQGGLCLGLKHLSFPSRRTTMHGDIPDMAPDGSERTLALTTVLSVRWRDFPGGPVVKNPPPSAGTQVQFLLRELRSCTPQGTKFTCCTDLSLHTSEPSPQTERSPRSGWSHSP